MNNSESPNTEKIQKFLANRGFGSRREMEEWIKQGRIRINGATATIGDRVSGDERIQVNGKPIDRRAIKKDKTKIVIYHKPVGEITTRKDPEKRPTVFAKLPKLRGAKWISIGRLDINTSGLLIFTNDGELANRFMHPAQQLDREYAVRVLGNVESAALTQLREGVDLEDGFARFSDIVESGGDGANSWFHVVIKEGRNREVRRLWEAVGLTVSRLVRVRFGTIILPRELRVGHWRFLDDAEVIEIKKSFGMTIDDIIEAKQSKQRRIARGVRTKNAMKTKTGKIYRKK